MRSTGEVAALDTHRSHAYLKALFAAGFKLPAIGSATWLSLPRGVDPYLGKKRKLSDQPAILVQAHRWNALGYSIVCSEEDASLLRYAEVDPIVVNLKGMQPSEVLKVFEEHNVRIVFELNREAEKFAIRRTAIDFDIPVITNHNNFAELVESLHGHEHDEMAQGRVDEHDARSLQEMLYSRSHGFKWYVETPEDRGEGRYANLPPKPKPHHHHDEF
jgi:hypothetical protein